MTEEYVLQTSGDGSKWTCRATFLKGEKSRWDTPFDANVAAMEAEGYMQTWRKDLNRRYTRIIINFVHERLPNN